MSASNIHVDPAMVSVATLVGIQSVPPYVDVAMYTLIASLACEIFIVWQVAVIRTLASFCPQDNVFWIENINSPSTFGLRAVVF